MNAENATVTECSRFQTIGFPRHHWEYQFVLLAVLFALALVFSSEKILAAETSSQQRSMVDSRDAKPVSLTLDQAIDIALKNNRALRGVDFSAEGSQISLGAARDVFDIKIRPLSSINYTTEDDSDITVWEVGGSVSKKFESGIELELKPSIAEGQDEYDAGVGFSLAVPLSRGFGSEVVLDNIRSNEFSFATSVRNVHQQRIITILETVTAVYTYVKEQHLINLYEIQLKELRNHLRIALTKKRIGLARNMDVYRVEIRIKEVEDTLNLAQERSENVLDSLKAILALPMNQEVIVNAPMLYTFLVVDVDDATALALSKRIEVTQGQANIQETLRKSKVAYLNTKPELDLEATYTRRGRSSELERLFVFDEDVFRIGLTSNTDFARSAEKAKWAQSKITVERERLKFVTIKENIVREVRRTLNSLSKSAERIHLRRQQIVQATGKQRMAMIKFQHGKADNFDLIESQAQLQRAKANLVSDEIQYIIGGYRLRASLGTLLEYNGI